MKAIVIGGAGFIGSHLVDKILSEHHKVICVDNFSLGTRANIEHLADASNFRLYDLDATNLDGLKSVFEFERPDMVFQLAANSNIQASACNPSVEYMNTYTTTFNTLQCMREYDVKKLFFASTSAVYGDKRDVVLTEDGTELTPISYYGACKLGCEALIHAFSYMNGIGSLIFRFPNVIGPRLTHGVVYDFISKLNRNPKELEILGNGKQTKPYIYVEDLVDCIYIFSDKISDGVSIYNVGVEGATSVVTIADVICKEMGLSDVEYHFTGGESGWKGDVPRFSYCLDKIHSAGWKAKYTSDEAVCMTAREELKLRQL